MKPLHFFYHIAIQAGGTLLSRISGLVRDIVIANYLGVGMRSDIFFIAFRLPNSFRKLFGEGAVSVTFVPIFIEELKAGKERALIFAGKVILILIFILCGIILLMEVFTPQVITILAPKICANPSSPWFELAIRLTRTMLPFMLLICLTAVFGGMLNSFSRFGHFAITPVILNIVAITFLLITKDWFSDIAVSLSYGIMLAGILQLSFLIAVCKINNILPSFRVEKPFLNTSIVKFFKNILPTVFAQGVFQINVLVDVFFASRHSGNISYLYYTDRLGQFATSIIGHTIGIVSLSVLSQALQKNGLEEGKKIQKLGIKSVIIWSLPAAFSLACLAPAIVKIIFERGEFTSIDTSYVSIMTQIFCASIPFICLSRVFQSSFYAMQDIKLPLKIGIGAVITNFIFNIILINHFPYYSVIISTACSAIIECLLLAYFLNRLHNFLALDYKPPSFILKIALLSAITALSSRFIYQQINKYAASYISLACSVIYGLAFYISFAILTKAIDIQDIKDLKSKSYAKQTR